MTEVAKFTDHAPAYERPADPMVSMIERLVTDPQADLDKLERMLAMKERIDAQNAQRAFALALSMARAEIPPIMKDATVDYKNKDGKRTHYQHETLAGIAKVIDPILSRHGLSYRFRTGQGTGGVTVTCIIQHADGYAEETTLAGSPDTSGSKNGFQAVGSAVTYLQRYTLKAALGLSAEVDDDGQKAAPRSDAPREEEPSEYDRAADNMITALRKHSFERVTGDENFQRDLAWLKREAPEVAARVEVEMERLQPPAKPRGPAINPNEIPY